MANKKAFKINDLKAPTLLCEPAGTRTQGPYIKSVLLYQLSYEFIPVPIGFGTAKITATSILSKIYLQEFSFT